jgi:hypothetical protein
MVKHQVDFTAQDILAAMGFEAQRLAAAVAQHAAGYPFPDPRALKQLIDRMAHLNDTLLKFKDLLTPTETSMAANSGMKVTLDG